MDSDFIHPDDIKMKMPEEKEPWWLVVGDISNMLLKFGRKAGLSMREKQVAARHLGILSKSSTRSASCPTLMRLSRTSTKMRTRTRLTPGVLCSSHKRHLIRT